MIILSLAELHGYTTSGICTTIADSAVVLRACLPLAQYRLCPLPEPRRLCARELTRLGRGLFRIGDLLERHVG